MSPSNSRLVLSSVSTTSAPLITAVLARAKYMCQLSSESAQVINSAGNDTPLPPTFDASNQSWHAQSTDRIQTFFCSTCVRLQNRSL